MDLVAALSNFQTEVLFQRLTRREWRQVRRPPPKPRDRAQDGKLKFGTISRAVLSVLTDAGGPLRFIEIHARVTALLPDTPISKGSVKAFLSAEAQNRGRPRFVRVGHGLYQLRGE
jgi:hypothetical protein